MTTNVPDPGCAAMMCSRPQTRPQRREESPWGSAGTGGTGTINAMATTDRAGHRLERPLIALEDAEELLSLCDLTSELPEVQNPEPVSATKNFVLRAHVTGLGLCYLKTARSHDGVSEQLHVEQRLWEVTRPGSTRRLTLADGRTVTVVKSAGQPPAELTAELAHPIAAGIGRIHQLPLDSFGDLELQTTGRTFEYLDRRLTPLYDNRSRDMARLALDLMGGLPIQPPAPVVVVHGDTTMLNFVVSERADGTTRASWIDLETAVLAPPEWDYGAIWLAATIEGAPDLADRFLDSLPSIDPIAYAWSMRQLLASRLAWAAWRNAKGNPTFREDLDMLTELVRDYFVREYAR
jgi:hypothetical protein